MLKMFDSDSDEYIGSHGTTITKSLEIEKEGFCPGSGERGVGVYFWENSIYAKKLALAWYIRTIRQKDSPYKDDPQKQCAIIWAKLEAGEDEFIDYTERKYQKQILELTKKLDIEDKREEACKLYEYFISLVEEELGHKIKFFIATVYPPQGKLRIFPTQICGMASCYIARDPSCINILLRETVEEFDSYNSDAAMKVLGDWEK